MLRLRLGLTLLGLLFGALVSTTAEAATVNGTCNSGAIPPGNYTSLTVTGVCSIPSGTVTVARNLTIAPNAALSALGGATLDVGGNALIGRGAILALGCTPELGCPEPTHDRIQQNLVAEQALAVILHGDTIGGNVSITGGGGGVSCEPNPVLSPIAGFAAPPYTDIEDTRVGRNLTVSGLRSCWLGVIRDQVGSNVVVTDNQFADPDATEIVTNAIAGNLSCSGNMPAAQIGDSGGSPNVVGGHKLGECSGL